MGIPSTLAKAKEKCKASSFSLYVLDCPLSLSAAADYKMLVFLKCKHNLPLKLYISIVNWLIMK